MIRLSINLGHKKMVVINKVVALPGSHKAGHTAV